MSAPASVGIIDTGIANIASIRAAFGRLDKATHLVTTENDVRDATWLVLPGVGSFGAGMERLGELGVTAALKDRISADKPLLAVCLGLQLLCRESEESPGVAGLGAVDAEVRRFRSAPLVPQLGWNQVAAGDCSLVEDGYAYYANSYRVADVGDGWRAAHTEHGERFVAALEKDAVLACQFHPELSGPWGHELLGRWLKGVA